MAPQLPVVTIEGRLTADPELRFIPSGASVCNFTIVCQDRKKDDDGKWQDVGTAMFINVDAWRQLGENVSESIEKGDIVVVTGKLSTREYTDKQGNPRTSLNLNAYTVAKSMQFSKIGGGSTKGSASTGSSTATAAADPWAAPSTTGSDEPPF